MLTYCTARDRFVFEPRGVVDVKGKGPMPTWFLLGRRQAAGAPGQAAVAEAGGPAPRRRSSPVREGESSSHSG